MKWPTKPLGEWPLLVIDGDRSSRYPKREEFTNSGVPFLNSTNFADDHLDISHLNYISPKKAAQIVKGKARFGDIVMTTRGTIGKVALYPKSLPEGVINAQMLIVRADVNYLDPRFLFHVFRSPFFQQKLYGFSSGSAQPQIPISDLKHVPISLPAIELQRRIADVLSSYDDLIEVNTRRIAVLEEMARRLFEDHFGRADVSALPEGWRTTTLGELVEEMRDAILPSTIPSDTPYVGLEHLPRRSTTLSDHGRADEVSSTKFRFQCGDILFGKIRPYFHKVAVTQFAGVASTDAIVMRPISQDARALAICLTSSDDFIAHAVQTSNGTKMPRANWGVLQKYKLAIPPEALLGRFTQIITANVQLCSCLAATNTKLRAARDLLLPKLISGEIDLEKAERDTDRTIARVAAA